MYWYICIFFIYILFNIKIIKLKIIKQKYLEKYLRTGVDYISIDDNCISNGFEIRRIRSG